MYIIYFISIIQKIYKNIKHTIKENKSIKNMLKEIYEDLEFISKIPKNCKPNFSDKSYTSTSEWFSIWKRRYKYEKGEKGMLYVNTLVENIAQDPRLIITSYEINLNYC